MKTFLRKSRILVIVFVIANLFFSSAAFGQATEPTVTLDQADLDYAPGETVYITGTGWHPGETVTLEVGNLTNPDIDCGAINPHLPWTVVADNAGNFSASWYVFDCELGANLMLEAYGGTSGFTFEMFFTDASQISILSNPSGTGSPMQTALSICSGTSVIFTAALSGGGCTYQYQWYRNGVAISGQTSTTYTTSTLINGDQIRCNQTIGSNGCTAGPSNTIIVAISAAPVATFSYTVSPYCSNTSNPSPTFAGGGTAGTFTATPIGLVFISTSTGQINLASSTPGTYTVKNTVTSVGCTPVEATSSVTIKAVPVATFSYTGTPYCKNVSNPSPTFSGGGTAGSFSATPAGLSINAVTGQIDLALSTAGTYTVKNSFAAAGGCPLIESTSAVTITVPPLATISYNASPYCSNSGAISVNRSGTAGGNYASTPAGLSLNASTGEVNAGTSTGGTYTVTYTIAASGGCPEFQTTASVTITTLPAATISYSGSPYCSNAGSASVTRTGIAGGTYSASPAGLIVDASTGAVNIGTSTPGTYTVTYKFVSTGGCPEVNATTSITINTAPTIYNVSFTGSLCGTATVTLSGTQTDVNYALKRNGATIETIAGTGSGISFTSVTQTGNYTVVATNVITGCSSTMNGSVDMGGGTPPTSTFAVTGGGQYCSGGAGVPVGLSSSETGVTYQLYLGVNPVGSSVAGTNAAISFGNQTVAGNYTVVGTKTSGGCTATMTGSVIVSINTAPILGTIGNQSVNEQANLAFTASATDQDFPAQILTYTLDATSIAAGMSITSGGAFSWTPTEVQGGATYPVTITVTDNGACVMNDFEILTITVAEVNVAPVLAAIGNKSVNEQANLSFTATATDQDAPAQTLTFTLDAASITAGMSITAGGAFSWTPTEAQGGATYPVTVTVTDNGLNAANLSHSETFDIVVAEVNVAPVLAAIGNKSVNQLTNLTFTATATDQDVPVNVLTFSLVGHPSGAAINASTGVFTWMPTGTQCDGTYTFTVRVTDNGSPALSDEEVIQVAVNNTLPAISTITGPSGPVQINTEISITVNHNDNNLSNAFIKWDDATLTVQNVTNPASGSFTVLHTYSTPGVYSILVTLKDACSANSTTVQYDYIVIYDPNGGFVTGGGWINSPEGASITYPTATGKANFGFVAKYKKGSTIPDGNTEFQFKNGNLNFNSTSYEDMRLVISGSKANYKGLGKINGSGNYGFLVSAIDGQVNGGGGIDKFRIKIWNKDNGNAVVYDNQMNAADNADATTVLGGGSIVIHEVKKANAKIIEVPEDITPFKVIAYPNPAKYQFTLVVEGGSKEKVDVVVYDVLGRTVKHIESSDGQAIEFGEDLPSGAYFTIVSQGAKQKTVRLIKQ